MHYPYYPRYYHYDYPRRRYYDYWYPYPGLYGSAMANLVNSQIASNNQSIYNAGVMAGVSQVANAININRQLW